MISSVVRACCPSHHESNDQAVEMASAMISWRSAWACDAGNVATNRNDCYYHLALVEFGSYSGGPAPKLLSSSTPPREAAETACGDAAVKEARKGCSALH